ncbi:MAG: hypothetical protein IT364_03015, partial [Candidatus Hydrogenedentes bacterium]|nr:hypothetical protein [Candidatus Hydrogenedentota bacterium]
MKRLLASFLPVLTFSVVCLPLTGCPTGTGTGPVLQINPVAINFGSLADKKTIGITNSGSGAITWSIQESIDWLSADVTVGTTTTELDRVKFTADRTGLAVGTYTGTVTVASSAGMKEIAVAMSVPGTPEINVNPLTINLLNNQETAEFTITNDGDGPLTWSIELQDADDPGTEIDIPEYMTISPTGGTTLPGAQSVVEIEIDRDLLEEAGVSGFLFFITSNAGN